MLSTGRPLDAEFQPATGSTPPPTDGAEMVIQDFNAFFEKLSGLDDVRWNDDSASAPSAGPVPAKTTESSATPHSAAPAPTSKPVAAPAFRAPAAPLPQGGAPRPLAPAAPASSPAAKHGVPLAFKLAMTALLLFGVGMGAGWLALSLPRGADRTLLTENPLVPMDSPAKPGLAAANLTAPAKSDGLAVKMDGASASAEASPEVTITAPSAPTAPAEPEVEAASVTGKKSDPANGEEPDAFSDKGTPAAASATPLRTGKAAPAERATANPGKGPAPITDARYAVQVGACTSAKCVENYRKLIQPHVGSHPVEVVQQAAPAGGPAVQRVRVEPLSRDQAQSLKQILEQADARLKNAYVVRLADRS